MMRERPDFGRLWRGVLVAAGAVVSCARAETSSLPESVNLQQLVHILREKSPRLIAERTRIDVAQAEVVAAEVLPNPTISYGRYDLVGGLIRYSMATSKNRRSWRFRCSLPGRDPPGARPHGAA